MTDDPDQNKKKPDASHDASRRRFLKGVGIAGAGAAFADNLLIEVDAKETQTGTAQPVSGNVDVALNINGRNERRRLSRALLCSTLCAIISILH